MKKVKPNPNPSNRKEKREGIHGKPPLWASANSIAKGRLLVPEKVKKANHNRKTK